MSSNISQLERRVDYMTKKGERTSTHGSSGSSHSMNFSQPHGGGDAHGGTTTNGDKGEHYKVFDFEGEAELHAMYIRPHINKISKKLRKYEDADTSEVTDSETGETKLDAIVDEVHSQITKSIAHEYLGAGGLDEKKAKSLADDLAPTKMELKEDLADYPILSNDAVNEFMGKYQNDLYQRMASRLARKFQNTYSGEGDLGKAKELYLQIAESAGMGEREAKARLKKIKDIQKLTSLFGSAELQYIQKKVRDLAFEKEESAHGEDHAGGHGGHGTMHKNVVPMSKYARKPAYDASKHDDKKYHEAA